MDSPLSDDRDSKGPGSSNAGQDHDEDSPAGSLGSRSAIADYVRSLPSQFAGWMLALYLDPDFNLLALDRVCPETAGKYDLKPMEFVRRGAKLGAIGFVLVHNAPERSTRAWPGELKMSKEIRRAGDDFDIHLLDHLILGSNRVFEIDP